MPNFTYVDAICDYSPQRTVWRQFISEHAQRLDWKVPRVHRAECCVCDGVKLEPCAEVHLRSKEHCRTLQEKMCWPDRDKGVPPERVINLPGQCWIQVFRSNGTHGMTRGMRQRYYAFNHLTGQQGWVDPKDFPGQMIRNLEQLMDDAQLRRRWESPEKLADPSSLTWADALTDYTPQRLQSGSYDPGGGEMLVSANFGRLVLGCTKAKFRERSRMQQAFSRSTQLSRHISK